MRLSKRIYKLADLINSGETAADIGTDHGYVPMLLIRSGKSPRAIMSDISEGSLSKARETFRQCGLSADPRDFRTGDGLSTLEPGETDAVIIGGLGGHTIAGILDADTAKSKSFKRFILQPRKHSGTLRYYLYVNGWDIESEHLVPEGKFVCEIIEASPSAVDQREAPYPEDDIRWKYPQYLMDTDPELAAQRIQWKIGSIEEQIASLYSSDKDTSETQESLKKDLEYLRQLVSVEKTGL